MTEPDPLEQLLRAADLREELDGLSADQIDLRLRQNEDLRPLVEPLLDDAQRDGTAGTERRIGEFRLVREIGRGGMGIVYEAWQPSLNRRVALKLLSPALGQDPASVARFQREATLAAGLSHPSLASVYGFEAGLEAHCLVMEFVDGLPCDRVVAALASRGIDKDARATVAGLGVEVSEASYEVFAARVVAEIAEALHHAHLAGVIHRDVKPANMIIRADGRAVLTDFGLARETGRQGVTVTGELTGTPAYQSPEQVGLSSVELGPLTDVFSLGVTLYELLTATKPFDGATVLETQQRIVRSRPTDPARLNPRVPRDLALILRKAMHKQPGDRYPDAASMAADLRRFAAAQEVRARPLSLPLRLRRWCQQNPLLASFHALIIVASIGIAAFWWRAESALTDFRWLAAGVRVEALRQAYRDAPPAWPQHAPQYRSWVEEAEVLCGWLPRFEQRVDRLRAKGMPGNDGGAIVFDDVEMQFLHDGNQRNLDTLLDVQQRILPELEEQLEWTAKIQRLSIDDYAAAWQKAAAAVAADSRFEGFELRPQLGLRPLRADPASGFWEFAHVRSGAAPEPGPDNRWSIGGEAGIVFVLMPPMRFDMGCQATAPDSANYDSCARERDGPVHPVTIGRPFFLSKYELSRGQWRRLGADLRIDDARDTADDADLDRYPLIGQSHDEVSARLHRFGLALPTEAQWEACCRAGSGAAWTSGPDARDLVAYANIRDQDLFDAREDVVPPPSPEYVDARDGYARQAPVDAFTPNAWGFHQMHGNVDELCRDGFANHYDPELPHDADDGLRRVDSTARAVRGGTHLRDVFRTGSGIRNGAPPGARLRAIGARPCRPIDP